MHRTITSRQHRIVAMFKSAARRDGELALLDGWHLLREAAAAHLDITTVAVSIPPPTALDQTLLQQLSRGCEVVTVTPSVMKALSPARTPAGVVALARPRQAAIGDLLTPSPALLLVAVEVQDPGNAGAIVRSAEAGGATGALFTGSSADPWGWKALRAAMGSTFRVPVLRQADTIAMLDTLQQAAAKRIAAIPRGTISMHEADLRAPLAFIVGGEGGGLDQEVLDHCDERVSIPMSGRVESLNVAVAAALLVYEARRQRHIVQAGGE
jgi:TrmH family RNA methyltransferase